MAPSSDASSGSRGGPGRGELEAAHCWESVDRVPNDPATTAFRREARLLASWWREAQGLPVGSQPIRPRPGQRSRAVGSRLPLDLAIETGATFLTEAARQAWQTRLDNPEPHQSIDLQRTWADLLWTPALACNLFGDLAADLDAADRAVHAWWPDTPGTVAGVRFLWSPGRLDPSWLNSLRQFAVAFELDLGSGARGLLAVGLRYHEWAKPETPKPENRWRTDEVHERSGAFRDGVLDELGVKSGLCELWLEHLLLLSMLQHPDEPIAWGRYVLVHPAGNASIAGAMETYRSMLADEDTFGATTLEHLLEADVLGADLTERLRQRYLIG